MIKKVYTLTEKNVVALEAEATDIGVFPSELLRRILDERYRKVTTSEN